MCFRVLFSVSEVRKLSIEYFFSFFFIAIEMCFRVLFSVSEVRKLSIEYFFFIFFIAIEMCFRVLFSVSEVRKYLVSFFIVDYFQILDDLTIYTLVELLLIHHLCDIGWNRMGMIFVRDKVLIKSA